MLAQRGVSACSILAHDYGDTVAQELLARSEEGTGQAAGTPEIDSVCFLNGGLFYEAIRMRLIQRLLLTPLGPLLGRLYTRNAFARSFRPLFGDNTQPGSNELDRYWDLMTRDGGRKVIHRIQVYLRERKSKRQRWVGAMQKTDVPLRLILGTADPVSGTSIGERYRELIPSADVIDLEGIGHYPQLEDSEAVVREYLAFRKTRGRADRG